MPKDVLTSLRKDWLTQEFVINSLPVPALAYFIWMCFPHIKEDVNQFFGFVLLGVTGCFTIGFVARKFAARKLVHLVKMQGTPNPAELLAAKIQALRFPFINSAVMFIRWTLFAMVLVLLPMYLKGKMNGFELMAMEFLLIFAAVSSLPFCFLCSERALAEFFSIPEIEKCDTEDKANLKLRITGKILLLNLLSIISLAGNFCVAMIIAYFNNIDIAAIKLGFFLLIVQSFILAALNGALLSINIRKFLGEILTFFDGMANNQGNLNRKIIVGSNDELGDLARLFNRFLVNLSTMIVHIKSNSNSLDVTSNNLSALAVRMNERAEQSSKTSNAVASSSEEMGDNLNSIVASMKEVAINVDSVAASTEEMSSTVNEIAQHTSKAKDIAETAVENVASAKTQVDELEINAREIDQITEVISEISEQTNLLALNATIEAARAGEAGKGFSVVANEIKELAKQTSEATARIKHMVAAIQRSSTGTTGQINEISEVIREVNNYVAAIAAAVEEQSAANREIAAKVSEVSHKNQRINSDVSQVSATTGGIVRDISQVSQSVDGVSEDSRELRQFGKEMSELSARLQHMVAMFNVD